MFAHIVPVTTPYGLISSTYCLLGVEFFYDLLKKKKKKVKTVQVKYVALYGDTFCYSSQKEVWNLRVEIAAWLKELQNITPVFPTI